MAYIYGMRNRPFSIGCQPSEGFLDVWGDEKVTQKYGSQYWDVIEYNRKLTQKEVSDYELDYLGKDDLMGA